MTLERDITRDHDEPEAPPPAAGAVARARRAITWRRAGIAVAVVLLAPVLPVGCLRWVDPPTSAFMAQRRLAGLAGADVPAIRYRWVDWEEISRWAPLAFVAAEDQRFPEHSGFDVQAVEEALEERRRGESLRGASTISQQVAKNLFLWPGRSWVRKGAEAYLTVWVELLWPKRRILEVYLNVAELGDGVYGVEAASQEYFGKSAGRLTAREAARLAVVLPSPRRYSVRQPSVWLQERAGWVQRQMAQLGSAYLEDL